MRVSGGRIVAVRILACVEQQSHDFGLAELSGNREGAMTALAIGGGEHSFHILKAAESGGFGDVGDLGSTADQRFGGGKHSEDDRGRERRCPVAAAARFEGCAEIGKDFDQRDLHARLRGVTARNEHRQCGRFASVHIGERVGIGAGFEQNPGDFDSVLWSFLAVAFDSIRGDVVKERCAVLRGIEAAGARGSGADQLGMVAQQRAEFFGVAGDDGFDRGFEHVYVRAFLRRGGDPVGEALPVQEVVGSGDGDSGVVKCERGRLDFFIRGVERKPFDFFIEESGMFVAEDIEGLRIARVVGVEEVCGLFFVIGERRVEGEVLEIHDASLSPTGLHCRQELAAPCGRGSV